MRSLGSSFSQKFADSLKTDVSDLSALTSQITSLNEEIDALKQTTRSVDKNQVSKLSKNQEYLFGGLTYTELGQVLESKKMVFPGSATNTGEEYSSNYFGVFITNSGKFNAGINSTAGATTGDGYLYKMASEMMVFGLVEQSYIKRGQITVSVLRTSSDGMKFIAEYDLRRYKRQLETKPEIKKEKIGVKKKDEKVE